MVSRCICTHYRSDVRMLVCLGVVHCCVGAEAFGFRAFYIDLNYVLIDTEVLFICEKRVRKASI